jgi:hypothetical protein
MRAPSPTRLALLIYGFAEGLAHQAENLVIRVGSNPHPNNNPPKGGG